MGGGSGSYSSGGSSGAGATGAGGGQALHTPEAASDGGSVPKDVAGRAAGHRFAIAPRYLQVLAPQDVLDASPLPQPVVVVVPRPLYAAYLARFRFFERRSHGGRPLRVILRSAPRG